MKSKFSLMLASFLLLCINFSFGQEKTISGNVTDQNGLPLPGVSVVVVGTTSGTQTDFDGNYTISAAQGQRLRFSYLGQKTVDSVVGTANTINVQMEEDAQALEEVVVTGYGTKSRELTTSAVVTVGKDIVKDFVPTTSIDNLLQGQGAGIQAVGANGRPGETGFIQIRGQGSINASTTPLYVIDGIPLSIDDDNDLNPLSNINPGDIESISILKDAASVSLYGSRGANGIVVITTKSGTSGEARVTFRSSYGFGKRTPLNFRLLNASEKLGIEADFAAIGVNAAANLPGATADAETRATLLARDTDWQDELLRSSVIQNNSLDISGGSEDLTYFLSLGYNRDTGITQRLDGFERLTARLNTSYQAKDWLKISTNLSFARSREELPRDRNNIQNPFRAILTYNPYETLFQRDADNNVVTDPNGNPVFNESGNLFFNIARALDTELEIERSFLIIGSLAADIKLSDKFSNRFTVGATSTRRNRTIRSLPGGVLQGFVGDAQFPGTQTENVAIDFEYNVNNVFTYSDTYGDKHNLSASFLLEYNENIFTNVIASGRGFPTPDIPYLIIAADPTNVSSQERRRTLFSQGLFVDYSYDNKYIASASVRRDGSSRFGPENKFGYFYSGSLAWNVSNEKFMEDSWFNNLKLRASFGTAGNQNIGNFEFLDLLAFNNTYNGNTTALPVGVGNPNIQWEAQQTLDVGVDFGLFNNRISGVVNYFVKTSQDLLLDRPLSNIIGDENNSIVSNVGEVENSGIEVTLNANVIRNENFQLSLGGNISFLDNQVNALVDGEDILTGAFGDNILREGEEISSYFIVEYAGVNPANGAPQYIDLDGNISETFSDGFATLQEGKSPLPSIIGGFNAQARYKGFGISSNFTFQAGNYILNLERSAGTSISNIGDNLRAEALNFWRQPGDTNVLPSPLFQQDADQGATTRFLERGDFIRLRNLTIDYNVPGRLLEKTGLSSLRIFATGQNIWTITGFNGDPEVGLGSDEAVGGEPGDAGFVPGSFNLFSYPQVQSYLFGVEVGF
ncbi:MAG: SusC/RagA family TonB-linked outer membrane protein [Bacteroidota bacterium]